MWHSGRPRARGMASCSPRDGARRWGQLVRIGHMGPTARPLYAIVALTALGGAIRALGHELDVAAGVAAALAVIDAGVDDSAAGAAAVAAGVD